MAAEARYDEIADFYDQFYGDQVQDQATDALLELAGEMTGVRALDLACGQGRLAREVARRGALVTGVDLSHALIEKAVTMEQQAPLSITYMVADAADNRLLPGQAFGVVLCNLSLTDFDNLDGILGKVARWLARDGRFVFSIPHPCFPGIGPIPSSWPPDGSYFEEKYWRTGGTGIRSRVGAHHRSISTYLNALSRHGLVIDVAAERPWILPDLPNLARLPGFFIARASKMTRPV